MRSKGEHYEDVAANYLQSIGYEVIRRNYYFGHKEIDIICVKEDVLLFVEVKYRKYQKDFNPFLAINQEKIDSMRACASDFLDKNEEYIKYYGRFDAVFVLGRQEGEEIVHLENIK